MIRKLLARRFRGRNALRRQVANALVRVIDAERSFEFRVRDADRAPVVKRIPVEAEAVDRDGRVIHALLHVVEGSLEELEFYKDDSSSIVRWPQIEAWSILILGGRDSR